MAILYVDESGDPGGYLPGQSQNSKHFILTGLVVPVPDWNNCMDRLKTFRQHVKKVYGLPVRTEVHASELIRINKIQAYKDIRKQDRIDLLKFFIREMPNIFSQSRIINICLHKTDFPANTNFKEIAWIRLLQRYDNYLKKSGGRHGIVVADGQEDIELRGLLRKMRVYNPVPSQFNSYRQLPTTNIIEDIFSRDSRHSYFIQAADSIAHVLYRKEYPKGSLRKYNLHKSFYDLDKILLKAASSSDPYGIVRK